MLKKIFFLSLFFLSVFSFVSAQECVFSERDAAMLGIDNVCLGDDVLNEASLSGGKATQAFFWLGLVVVPLALIAIGIIYLLIERRKIYD